MIEIQKINTKYCFAGIALLALLLMPQQLLAATVKIDQVMAFPPELNVSGGGEYVSIGYSLSENARVRIIIYGPQHEQIKVLQDWTGQGSGSGRSSSCASRGGNYCPCLRIYWECFRLRYWAKNN